MTGTVTLPRPQLTKATWKEVEQWLPKRQKGERKAKHKLSDRLAFGAVLLIAFSHVEGIPISWQELPRDIAQCDGRSVWRRFKKWIDTKCWPSMWAAFVEATLKEKHSGH